MFMKSRLGSSALFCMLITSCILFAYTHPRYGGVIRLHVKELPVSLDPVACRDERDMPVFGLLYRTIFECRADGTVASRFFTAYRRDGESWLLTPHPAKTSNGQAIGLDVLRQCIERGIAQQSFVSMTARTMLFGGDDFVSGKESALPAFEAQSDGSFILRTRGPQPYLPHVLSRSPFFVATESGGEYFGNGPFKLSAPTAPGAMNLVANQMSTEPFLERVEVVTGDEGSSVIEIVNCSSPHSSGGRDVIGNGGIPRTLLLGLNPLNRPFEDATVRRNFLGSLAPQKLILPSETGTIRAKCSYLPQMIAAFPAVSSLRPEAPAVPAQIICKSHDINIGQLAPAFPPGVELIPLQDEDFKARLNSGDYQAFLIEYQHGFLEPALDLLELLSITKQSDPIMLDAENRLTETMRMEDRSAIMEIVLAVEKTLAESGLLFPLAEFTPAIPIDNRLRDVTLNLFWNPVIENCWIGE